LTLCNEQRKVQKEQLENLSETDVVVIQDFTKFNNVNTKHVNDLVWVVYKRDPETNQVRKYYIDHFALPGSKQTFEFVKSVWELNFQEKVFEGIKKVIVWSDTGPQHFKIKSTIAWFSILQFQYNVRFSFKVNIKCYVI
jgi:hypothetical protein